MDIISGIEGSVWGAMSDFPQASDRVKKCRYLCDQRVLARSQLCPAGLTIPFPQVTQVLTNMPLSRRFREGSGLWRPKYLCIIIIKNSPKTR